LLAVGGVVGVVASGWVVVARRLLGGGREKRACVRRDKNNLCLNYSWGFV
jgi:hypothetical protein